MPYRPPAGDLGHVHIACFAPTSHCLALCRLEETLSCLFIKPFCANEVVFSRGQVPSHNLQRGCKLAGPRVQAALSVFGVKTLAQILHTFPRYMALFIHITPEKRFLFQSELTLNLALCFLHQYKITGPYIQFTQIHSIPLVSMAMYGYESPAWYWVIISVYSDLKSYFSCC